MYINLCRHRSSNCRYVQQLFDLSNKILFISTSDAEKAGAFNDELESITVANGKVVLQTGVNGSPLPNQVNYGFETDTDETNNVRL